MTVMVIILFVCLLSPLVTVLLLCGPGGVVPSILLSLNIISIIECCMFVSNLV